MQEAQFQSLGWEDPLEKEMAIHSSILAWEIPWTVELKWAIVHRVAKELDRTQQINNDNKNYWGVTPGSIFVVLEPLIIVTLNVYVWWNCVQPYTKKEIKRCKTWWNQNNVYIWVNRILSISIYSLWQCTMVM